MSHEKSFRKIANSCYIFLIKHHLTHFSRFRKRISIKDTRAIIDAILDGSIEKAETKNIPYFDFKVPVALHDVNPGILDPRDTYATPEEWNEKAKELAGLFIENFEKFTHNEAGKALVKAGPRI